jgi:hypothetical protein
MVNGHTTEARQQIPVRITMPCHAASQHLKYGIGAVIVCIEVWLCAMVLYFNVHPHLAARVKHFIKRGDEIRKLTLVELRNDTTVGNLGVVVHHDLTATTLSHVEFDGVGAHFPGTRKCLGGIGALCF